MKKLIIPILLVSVLFSSCKNQHPAAKEEVKAVEKAIPVEKAEVIPVVKEHTGTIKLNKQQFLEQIVDYEKNSEEWIYKGELPGLIDFYADWCRPCRITSPIIEELAIEYAGKVNMYKIDIQVEKELASIFQVQSIPSFLYIPMGGTPVMSSGISSTPEATKAMFIKQIEEILLKK